MKSIINFLFPDQSSNNPFSLTLLLFRILFGILLMIHGIQKWESFSSLSQNFPDPIGFGSEFSLCLAIFAELICSIAFIFGFLYRLALIPMIFTMVVAFFVIHGNDPFSSKELPFVYLIAFAILYISGPGKYSIDYLIGKKIHKSKR